MVTLDDFPATWLTEEGKQAKEDFKVSSEERKMGNLAAPFLLHFMYYAFNKIGELQKRIDILEEKEIK